jgi:hypothetical protein
MLKVIGGEQEGEFKAVASGTLPNGKPVVVNADGTVSVVGEESYSETLSSGTVFNTGNTIRLAAGFDSVNNKVIIAYHNVSTSTGYAIVGTVSGDTISFGTHVQFENAAVEDLSISVDTANDRVVIFYRDNGNSNYGTAIVGTVSGTSISFGTPVVFSSYYSQYNSSVYDTTSGKVIVANRDGSVTDDGSAYVGTVSGTSISFGSAQTFDNGSVGRVALVYDASVDRVVVAYKTGGTVNTKVGTVSGSTISFGSIQDHGGANIDKVEATGDNNGTIFICYNSGNSGSQASAFLATIGTSSITKGTTVNFDTEVPEMAPIYDSAFDKYVILYRINSPSNAGLYIVGSASGTTLTFESPVTYYNDNAEDVEIAFDSNSNKVVFVYRDSGDGGKGTARVLQNAGSVSNLTAENYIGMSQGAVTETSEVVGTESVFDTTTAGILDSVSVYDPDTQKTIIAYADRDNNDAVTAVVATVTGTTFSFGTPVVADSCAYAEDLGIAYDTVNDRVIITYTDTPQTTGYGTAVVGQVSGTSITFGTPVVYETALSYYNSIDFDTNSGKVVIAYMDSGNSNYGTAIVGTVSGTSISFGTPVVFNSGTSQYMSTVYDPSSQKTVIAYRDSGTLNRGEAIVGTVSGTSISFGSVTLFDSTSGHEADNISAAYDPDTQQVIVAYREDNISGLKTHGRAVVGSVSGTSITFGDPASFNAVSTQYIAAGYDTNANKVVVAYRDRSNSDYGTVVAGSIDGTSLSFETPVVYSGTDAVIYIGASYNESAGSFVISYRDMTSLDGTAVAYQASYIQRYPVADGDSASLDIIGSVSDNQLSLTAGEKYYVQTNGTLSTTAGSPSVLAGTAISATELLVKT